MRRASTNGSWSACMPTAGGHATAGRTADGRLMVPAIALHHLVTGLRREAPDARARLTDYLVRNFHEIVYI